MLKKLLRNIAKALSEPQVERSAEEQQRVDKQTRNMALYHYMSCPFCADVRQVIKQLSLVIELRDINQSASHRTALIAGGGRQTVPCLRIEQTNGSVQWLYESHDINRLLRERFAPVAEKA